MEVDRLLRAGSMAFLEGTLRRLVGSEAFWEYRGKAIWEEASR